MAWRSKDDGVTGDPIFPPALGYQIMEDILPPHYFSHPPPEVWTELHVMAKDRILTVWRVDPDMAGEVWELAMAHPDMRGEQ